MRTALTAFVFLLLAPAFPAAEPAPVLKIEPGRIIVPTGDQMRRPNGEIMSLDLVTRTGTLRHESGEILPFAVLPYALLFQHGATGDLRDYRIGEWVSIRLHLDEEGKWTWLTYIQDDLRRMLNHQEFFHVERIDAARGHLVCTLGNTDRSFIRKTPGAYLIEADEGTRFWKAGRAATIGDVRTGDRLLARLHGTGHGARRIAWEIFLDEASAQVFTRAQIAVHARRMTAEGCPGYVETVGERELRLVLFREGHEAAAGLARGQSVRVAMAGPDRQATTSVVEGNVSLREGDRLSVALSRGAPADFTAGGVFRLWPTP